MFNIGFFKGQPTEYIVEHVGGRVRREGPGLAFYYLKYRTQIVAVPANSADANFVFNELTSNFQAITVQGQFTYLSHPRSPSRRRAAELHDRSRPVIGGSPY